MDHIKIMLGEFDAVLGREYFYKTTFGNDS